MRVGGGFGRALRATAVTIAMATAILFPARPDASAAASQTQSEVAPLEALQASGQAAFAAGRWDAATAAFESLRDAARRAQSDLWVGRALVGLGMIAEERAKYPEARAQVLEALKLFESVESARDIAWAHHLLADNAQTTGDRAEASARYGQAAAEYAALGDPRRRLRALWGQLETTPAGENYWKQMGALVDEAHASGDADLEGRILHSWSDQLFGGGDYEGALEKLQGAAAALETANSPDELGTVYNSMGRLFRLHGQYAAALQCQLKALAIHEKLGATRSLIQSLNAVAVTYQTVNDKVNAEKYYARALTLATDAGDRTILTFLRANYASFLADFGDPVRGRAMMLDAIADSDGRYLATRYQQLSEMDLAAHRSAVALEEAQKSLDACGNANGVDCIDARIQRARVEHALGDDAAALDDQQTAIRAVESLHARLPASDFLKQGFEGRWTSAYSLAITLHLQRGEIAEALEAAELARSRALLDLLASRNLQEAGARSATLPLSVAGAADAAPNLAVTTSATIADLRRSAARLHSTLVVYWVGDDRIDEWTLAPDGALHSTTVPIARRQLDAWIHATSAFLDDSPARGPATTTRGGQGLALAMKPQAAWGQLYDVLVKPIAQYLPAAPGALLTIVPHGPLLNVPFGALRDAAGHYLIERYAIHSVPAGGLLAYTGASLHANARTGPVLLVADPARPPAIVGEPPLPRLPGASAEVRAIATLLPASRTTLLASDEATEARVVGAVPRQAVIHFATHAIAEDADPLASFLALSRPAGATSGGRLTAEAIYHLRLDADLVVLSACRSGGAITNGDGVAALARAFFYAGAPSLVVSLWDVADQPTNRLLPAFYRGWLQGADKAHALREAQLELIADLRAGKVVIHTAAGDITLPEDPAFWAGFVLLGEPK